MDITGRRQTVALIAVALALAACASEPSPAASVNTTGPLVLIDRHIRLECRGVERETCATIGEVAAEELPVGATVTGARLAPAQNCFGESPCEAKVPDCHVYASVIFDTHVPNGVVIDVIVIHDTVAQVTSWTGPIELGEFPIRDDVGELCASSEPVP